MSSAASIPADGIHPGMSMEQYVEVPLPSQSALKRGDGDGSMAHVRAAMVGDRKPTDTMLRGSAVHLGFLEPWTFHERVVCWQGKMRRGKQWEDFQAEHAGKIILTPGIHETAWKIVKALHSNPIVRELASKMVPSGIEVVGIGPFEGLRMKGRTDVLTDDMIIDIKTTTSTAPSSFYRTIEDYGYDFQAAVYRELFGRSRSLLVAVESSEPFDVVVFELPAEMIDAARERAAAVARRYIECEASGVWPGRKNGIVTARPSSIPVRI